MLMRPAVKLDEHGNVVLPKNGRKPIDVYKVAWQKAEQSRMMRASDCQPNSGPQLRRGTLARFTTLVGAKGGKVLLDDWGVPYTIKQAVATNVGRIVRRRAGVTAWEGRRKGGPTMGGFIRRWDLLAHAPTIIGGWGWRTWWKAWSCRTFLEAVRYR